MPKLSPTKHPALTRIKLKVERANDHFDDFKAEFGLGPRPAKKPLYAFGIEYQPGWTHVQFQTDVPEIQPEACIVLGDAIHQMRASLDHLVSYLFLQKINDLKALRNVWFPIYHSKADFLNDCVKPLPMLIAAFGPRTSAIFTELEESQPYKRTPSAPTTDALWVLRELDNIDKHRTVLVLDNRASIACTAFSEDGIHRQPFSFRKEPIKAGAQILNFAWPHPVPPANVQVDRLEEFVVFDGTDGLCDNLSVFPQFTRIREAVNQTIDRFERFF